MREERDPKLEYVLFKCNGPQVRSDATVPQLSGVLNSLMAACKRPEQHDAPSAASPLYLESLLSSSVSNFIDGFSCLVIEEVATHSGRSTECRCFNFVQHRVLT